MSDLLHFEDFAAGQGTDGYRANVRAFIKRIRRKFERIDAERGFQGKNLYPDKFGQYRVDAEKRRQEHIQFLRLIQLHAIRVG